MHISAMPATMSHVSLLLLSDWRVFDFHSYALPRAAGMCAHRPSFCQPALLFNSRDPCTDMGCLAAGHPCPQYRDWSHGGGCIQEELMLLAH